MSLRSIYLAIFELFAKKGRNKHLPPSAARVEVSFQLMTLDGRSNTRSGPLETAIFGNRIAPLVDIIVHGDSIKSNVISKAVTN